MALFGGIKSNMRKAQAAVVLINTCLFSSLALADVTIASLQRDAKLSEYIADYSVCLKDGQTDFFYGSDDVGFLVEHISALCKYKVDKIVSMAGLLGANADLARILETSVIKAGKEELTSRILRDKARENKARLK